MKAAKAELPSQGSMVRSKAFLCFYWVIFSALQGSGESSELVVVLVLPIAGSDCELATMLWKESLQGLSQVSLVGTWMFLSVCTEHRDSIE